MHTKNLTFYEKTELSEIAPRPTPLTLNLLHLIYGQAGPVQKVYHKHGITYTNTDFIALIQGELFVDKEKEIQGLLPGYKYVSGDRERPKFRKFSKFFPTLKNLWALNTIKTSGYEQLFVDLKTMIEKEIFPDTATEALKNFLADYELLFEINVLSGLAVKKLQLQLKNEPIHFLDLVEETKFFDPTKFSVKKPTELIGNTLELTDTSTFTTSTATSSKSNPKVTVWWNSLSDLKKKIVLPTITEALVYNHLRELGRWLTVKNKTKLHLALLKDAGKMKFKNVTHIFYAPEILSVLNITEDICLKNKVNYEQSLSNPAATSQLNTTEKNKLTGLAGGQATGILLSPIEIDSGKYAKEPIILYTEILAPDLTRYFDTIVGIVSNKGSLLSHLAIVAREQGIPLVAGFSLGRDAQIGDLITLDGNKNTLVKM